MLSGPKELRPYIRLDGKIPIWEWLHGLKDDGPHLIILLMGGDKSTQRKDIHAAQTFWQDYQRRIYGTQR